MDAKWTVFLGLLFVKAVVLGYYNGSSDISLSPADQHTRCEAIVAECDGKLKTNLDALYVNGHLFQEYIAGYVFQAFPDLVSNHANSTTIFRWSQAWKISDSFSLSSGILPCTYVTYVWLNSSWAQNSSDYIVSSHCMASYVSRCTASRITEKQYPASGT